MPECFTDIFLLALTGIKAHQCNCIVDFKALLLLPERVRKVPRSIRKREQSTCPLNEEINPATELANTTLPGRFSSTHLRMNFCASSRGAKTLVSKVRRTRSTGISHAGPFSPIPALLKRMSHQFK